MSRYPIRPPALTVLALSMTGCGALMAPPPPDGLAYGRPDPNPATYAFADTAEFAIETAMGPMEVVTSQAGEAEVEFRRRDAAYQVFVRFPRFEGTFRNPAQGESRVDASDIGGPFTLRVSYEGHVEVTDTPSLSVALLDIAGPYNLVRPLFIRLPGRPVEVGARWVDTVTTREVSSGTESVARSVVTSTLAGDSVVAGRRLLVIRTHAENAIEVTGVSGGVEIEQRLEGESEGVALWDEAARLLVERWEEGRLTGTLELPGAGVPGMLVHARVRRSVSLRD